MRLQNNARLGVLVGVGALALAACSLYLLDDSPDVMTPDVERPADQARPSVSNRSEPVPPVSVSSDGKGEFTPEVSNDMKRPHPVFSHKEYLNAATNEADALGALYSFTKDPKYLSSLKEKALTDPKAALLYAILSYSPDNPDQGWGERLSVLRAAHKNAPNDVPLTAALAGIEAKMGNHQDALTLLNTIKNTSAIRNASLERQKAVRELMLLNGTDVAEAWKQASSKEGDNLLAFCTMVGPLVKSIKGISQLPLDVQIEKTSAVVALAHALNPDDDAFGLSDIVSLNLEKEALRRLPSSVAYGDDGKTVGVRLAEIENIYKRADYLRTHVYPVLGSGRPGVLQGFLERREQYGAAEAVAWLEKLIAAGK